jgi:predicted PurR-regulated permease PerM
MGGVLFLILCWLLLDVILLALAAVLFAVALNGLSSQIAQRSGMSYGLALTVVSFAILGLLVAVVILFGTQLVAQLMLLAEQLPASLEALQKRFGVVLSMGDLAEGPLSDLGKTLVGQFARIGGVLMSGIATLVFILVASVYIAVNPSLYRRGMLALVPPRLRARMDEVFDTTSNAWSRWFGAQLLAMLIVAVLVGIGTSLIGLPAPLALGLIAGLLEFIPIVGSFLGALPALLFAFSQGGEAVWWTLALFVGVQQLESNVISPILQQRIVSLPPALLLFAIVAAGTLLGPVGVFLAAPLTILAYILLVTFYVRGALGEDATAPGEE